MWHEDPDDWHMLDRLPRWLKTAFLIVIVALGWAVIATALWCLWTH